MSDQAHRYALRVQWEDTDAAGIVYYANYLRFIERARSDLLLQHGIDQLGLMRGEEGIAFAVRACNIEYLKPARLHEELTVFTTITESRGASVSLQQDVWRGEEVLARALVKLACIDQKGRPTRVPRAIAAIFATLSPNLSR
ncbi:YbgC/FadM family acyl-CoA thioesterase [uncultured Ferrovibrio sp.]|jgi:acyl-CoA thioester hydrolase|uniref:YbgC/FadM family acyl-CoA thioesterase n=1 Tax=uncultured Ferrovibrio sp. TaxID=1576913 RepID=UPI0026385F75|nr:YbgC/FadM family acyl-CoA thioesterase [uncultured Ferrovibrio sp.]